MNATTDRGESRRNTGGNGHGAAELEREGDQIRGDMDRTLDELERKLSPGKMLDRSVEFIREHGAEFFGEVGDTVRRNPMPVLVTAAGLVWLTASVARSRSQPSVRSRGNTAGSHIDEDMDSFQDFADGQGYASRTHASGETIVRKASSRFTQLVREQPVMVGALALAGGALLGAALPASDYENRMMGPTHDRAIAGVKEAGRQQYEKIREAVAPSTGERSDDVSDRPSTADE